MTRLGLAMVALLAGCGDPSCPPLPLVPISWAPPEQEQVLRTALAGFEETLALPVCIDHVRIGRPFRGGGQYNPVTRGITLLPPPDDYLGETDGRLRDALLHEVCHGVDLQNEVVDGREGQFPFPGATYWREWRLPREAFADTCALGAEALALVGRADCPDDPDLRGAGIVAREVFGAGGAPATVARYTPSVGDVEVPELADIDVSGSTRGEDPLPEWADERTVTVGDDSLAVARLEVPTGTVFRFVARSGGGWAPVDDGPCPNESTDLFTVDGQIRSIQRDDGVLSGGSWSFAAEDGR